MWLEMFLSSPFCASRSPTSCTRRRIGSLSGLDLFSSHRGRGRNRVSPITVRLEASICFEISRRVRRCSFYRAKPPRYLAKVWGVELPVIPNSTNKERKQPQCWSFCRDASRILPPRDANRQLEGDCGLYNDMICSVDGQVYVLFSPSKSAATQCPRRV